MALNLWKVAGKPVAYNPLPTGAGNVVDIKQNLDYIVRFKAKSTTSAVLQVCTSGFSNLTEYTLTSEFVTYEKSFNSDVRVQFFLIDKNNIGNIIIDSIQLVQKPLPKLTINGVDGFQSGKWTLHANTMVVDDETLVLNATGADQVNFLNIPVLPNTTYTFKGEGSNFYVNGRNSGGAWVADYLISGLSQTFTTNATTASLNIGTKNATTGQFTFKRPVLNLGPIPAPYEKKRGERMVLPVAKKNLFDGQLQSGYYYSSVGVLTPDANSLASISFSSVYPGKSYSISNSLGYSLARANEYDINKNHLRRVDMTGGKYTASSDAYFIKFSYYQQGNDITNKIQLEEGNVATPYTPYAVQMSGKPKLRPIPYSVQSDFVGKVSGDGKGNVAKRSFTPGGVPAPWDILQTPSYGNWVEFDTGRYSSSSSLDGSIHSMTGNVNGYIAQMIFSFDILAILEKRFGPSIWQGVTDVASKVVIAKGLVKAHTCNWHGYGSSPLGNKGYFNIWAPGSGVWASRGNNSVGTVSKLTAATNDTTAPNYITADGYINYLSNADPSNGTIASTINTDFVELILDVAKPELLKPKTGLSFNGVTDYLQLPSMTMDSIEIDCLIDSVQSGSYAVLDARSGLGSGFLTNASLGSWNGITADNIPIIAGSIPLNRRMKIKAVKSTPFTDDVNIFSAYDGTLKTKGTLYKVTCYLAGQVVAQYDFENPNNLVGDKIIPNAKNLIPSFEDSRWSLHANAQVLGKDYLRLNASANSQYSLIKLNVVPNVRYRVGMTLIGTNITGPRMRIGKDDGGVGTFIVEIKNGFTEFTCPSDTTTINVILDNNTTTGQFDFIKPQLYQLDGNEGTLTGTPSRLNKASKRILYAKR